jgi:hypothetical protein
MPEPTDTEAEASSFLRTVDDLVGAGIPVETAEIFKLRLLERMANTLQRIEEALTAVLDVIDDEHDDS